MPHRDRLIPFYPVVPPLKKFYKIYKTVSFNPHRNNPSLNPADKICSPKKSPQDDLDNSDKNTNTNFTSTERHRTILTIPIKTDGLQYGLKMVDNHPPCQIFKYSIRQQLNWHHAFNSCSTRRHTFEIFLFCFWNSSHSPRTTCHKTTASTYLRVNFFQFGWNWLESAQNNLPIYQKIVPTEYSSRSI